jgi:hypothetical protein
MQLVSIYRLGFLICDYDGTGIFKKYNTLKQKNNNISYSVFINYG